MDYDYFLLYTNISVNMSQGKETEQRKSKIV